MDSKTLWAVVIVAIVASLITAFVTVKLTGNVINVQPSTTGQPVYNTTEVNNLLKNVNAASCSAGFNCNVKSIYGINKGNSLNLYSIDNRLSLYGETSLFGNVTIVEAGKGWRFTKDYLINSWGINIVSPNISVNSLAGSGNAYICVDSIGKLYRSSSACSTSTTPITYILNVAKTGTGKGDVIGTDIYCGSLCSANYAPGKIVSLVAYPAVGSKFVSWSGACAGTSQNCTVTMDMNKFVTAQFSV